MRKTYIAAVAIVLLLTACGWGQEAEVREPEPTKESEETEPMVQRPVQAIVDLQRYVEQLQRQGNNLAFVGRLIEIDSTFGVGFVEVTNVRRGQSARLEAGYFLLTENSHELLGRQVVVANLPLRIPYGNPDTDANFVGGTILGSYETHDVLADTLGADVAAPSLILSGSATHSLTIEPVPHADSTIRRDYAISRVFWAVDELAADSEPYVVITDARSGDFTYRPVEGSLEAARQAIADPRFYNLPVIEFEIEGGSYNVDGYRAVVGAGPSTPEATVTLYVGGGGGMRIHRSNDRQEQPRLFAITQPTNLIPLIRLQGRVGGLVVE